MNYEYNKHYIDEYPGYVKKVITDIRELYNYLKTFHGNNKYRKCYPNFLINLMNGKFKWINKYKNAHNQSKRI